MAPNSAPNSVILRQFDYQPRKWQMIVLFLLATAGVVLLTYFAFNQQGNANVRGFQLSQRQGRTLFGIGAVVVSFGLPLLGLMVYAAFTEPRRIALTKTHLVLPRPSRIGLSREEIQIPFDTVLLVTVHKFVGPTMLLRLDYVDGGVSIPSNMIGSRKDFDELCKEVKAAVASASGDREI